jgi:hypothetical protein
MKNMRGFFRRVGKESLNADKMQTFKACIRLRMPSKNT